MKTAWGVMLAVVIAIGLMVVPAQALMNPVTLTLTDCPSCYGSDYQLVISEIASGLYSAWLSVDTSGYTGKGLYITAVDFKVASDVTGINLLQAPGGIGGWSASQVGINNGGCETPGSGFVCSENALTFNAPTPAITTYDWKWTFTLPGDVTLNLADVHIGAKYNNAAGTLNGQITSESVPVPEPSTLLLLGSGLLGLGGFAWRRNRER